MPSDFSYYDSSGQLQRLNIQVGQSWSDAAKDDALLISIFNKLDKMDGKSDDIISERELTYFNQIWNQVKLFFTKNSDDAISHKGLSYLANNLTNRVADNSEMVVKGNTSNKEIAYMGYKIVLDYYDKEENKWISKDILNPNGESVSMSEFYNATGATYITTSVGGEEYTIHLGNPVSLNFLGEGLFESTQEFSFNVSDLFSLFGEKDAKTIYDELELQAKGMSFEVFEMALEGYRNLPEDKKTTGMLGIFDTSQDADKERYYLIDLENNQIVGTSILKTGRGNMDDIENANEMNSNATLSGFEQVSEEYYSTKMRKQAMKIDGLEPGINNTARKRGTVVHYATGAHTQGCKGFTPVLDSSGKIDITATNAKMHELFPQGTILFTFPTDDSYKERSQLV